MTFLVAKNTTKKRRREVSNRLPAGLKLLSILEGHQDTILSLAFDRKGDTLASGGYHGTIKLWDMRNGKLLRTLKNVLLRPCS